MGGIKAFEKDPKALADYCDEMERLRQEDPVKATCRMWEEADRFTRPTLFKLEKGDREDGLVEVGDWVVDANGEILDIVHICDREGKFYSPTVLLQEFSTRRGKVVTTTVSKSRDTLYKGDGTLVCVTCGAKPQKDVEVAFDLFLRRQDNMEKK